MTVLTLKGQKVRIDHGELVGYEVNGHEFIHQKGSPGWRSSDTEMFPIIGPTNEAGYTVNTPRGKAAQDQHGLLREMSYTRLNNSTTKAGYQKEYKAGTKISNSKYPEKSVQEKLSWPYSFTFTKIFELTQKGLEIKFGIMGEEGMPFMLGYHPAFKIYSENAQIMAGTKVITIPEIIAVGNRAMLVEDRSEIAVSDQEDINIISKGFKHFMLWTPVPNMVCVEPITFYPYAVQQNRLDKGFTQLSKNGATFSVKLLPKSLNL